MAQISAKDVKQLREMTGVGMMDCKKALQEADGDIEAAKDLLRKKGMKTAEKKADRAANEGKVVSAYTDNGQAGVLLAVRCETDFVVKNEKFAEFVDRTAQHVLANPTDSADELMGREMDGKSIETTLKELIGLVGENMAIHAVASFKVDDNGRIADYIHHDGRLGVMLSVEDEKLASVDQADVDALLKDLCMQIASAAPVSVDRTGIPADLVEREKAIYKDQMADAVANKPPEIVDKILTGKLGKFYQEHCLLEQEFINPAKFKGSVADRIKQVSPSMTVTKFVRVELGD